MRQVFLDIETTAYADPTSIRRVGDIVKMRTRVDYKPVEMVDGKKQKTIIAKAISVAWSQGEYDCKNIQFREDLVSKRRRNWTYLVLYTLFFANLT